MLLQNVFTILDNKINAPKLNNSLKDFFEKINKGTHRLCPQSNTVLKKLTNNCWTTKLHTPHPQYAKIIAIPTDNTAEIRLIVAISLNFNCFFKRLNWIMLNELIINTIPCIFKIEDNNGRS